MKHRIIPAMALLLCLLSLRVYAQEIREPTIDERLGLTKPKSEETKEDKTVKDLALDYYDLCRGQHGEYLDLASTELLCSCTANELEKYGLKENLLQIFSSEPSSTSARRALLKDPYGPCMHFAVKNFISGSCQSNPTLLKTLGKHHKIVCGCYADLMSRHTAQYHDQITKFYSGVENVDMAPLKNWIISDDFSKQSERFLTRCTQFHVLGYK